MKATIISKIFYLSTLAIFFSACAQVVAPTGGPRDIAPPEVLVLKPANSSLNFESKTIAIEFDEYVKLNKLSDELLVSPPLKNKITTTIKGKTLIIELNDTLKENTTYVMNFGNAIVDINENNKLENFQYVFSTGNSIDSLTASGTVIDAFSATPAKEMLVMLYEESNKDSIPYLELPNYISRTDKEGHFLLSNIAAGNYFIFALEDANSNYLFDRPSEKIAFIEEPISITSSIEGIEFHAFEELNPNQFIKKQSLKNNLLVLAFNEPVDSLSFSGVDTNISSLILNQHLSVTSDSALFWWKEAEESKFRIEVKDGSKLTDTVRIKLDSLSKKNSLKLESSLSKKHPFYRPISLVFNRPIQDIDTSLISLINSDSLKIPYQLKLDSIDQRLLRLSFEFEVDSTYSISILPTAFTDIYGRASDSIQSKINFDNPTVYGSLQVTLSTEIPSIAKVIQLTDAKGNVVKEQVLEQHKTTFKYLRGGNYRLKLIVDENNNGHWDPGKYLDKKQAERIILYDENITIRSNWDKEIEWIVK